MIVFTAKMNKFAPLRIGRAKQRVNFRSTNFPRFLTVRANRRKPCGGRTGRRVNLRLQRGLFEVRKKLIRDAQTIHTDAAAPRDLRRKIVVHVMMILHRQNVLLHVVGALHTTSSLARRLDCRKKQTD